MRPWCVRPKMGERKQALGAFLASCWRAMQAPIGASLEWWAGGLMGWWARRVAELSRSRTTPSGATIPPQPLCGASKPVPETGLKTPGLRRYSLEASPCVCCDRLSSMTRALVDVDVNKKQKQKRDGVCCDGRCLCARGGREAGSATLCPIRVFRVAYPVELWSPEGHALYPLHYGAIAD